MLLNKYDSRLLVWVRLGDNGSTLCEDRWRVYALCYWLQGENAAAQAYTLEP